MSTMSFEIRHYVIVSDVLSNSRCLSQNCYHHPNIIDILFYSILRRLCKRSKNISEITIALY